MKKLLSQIEENETVIKDCTLIVIAVSLVFVMLYLSGLNLLADSAENESWAGVFYALFLLLCTVFVMYGRSCRKQNPSPYDNEFGHIWFKKHGVYDPGKTRYFSK